MNLATLQRMNLSLYLPLNLWNIITQYLDFETFENLTPLDPDVFNLYKYSLNQLNQEAVIIYARKYQKLKILCAEKIPDKRINFNKVIQRCYGDFDTSQLMNIIRFNSTIILIPYQDTITIGDLNVPDEIKDKLFSLYRKTSLATVEFLVKDAYENMIENCLELYHNSDSSEYRNTYFKYLSEMLNDAKYVKSLIQQYNRDRNPPY